MADLHNDASQGISTESNIQQAMVNSQTGSQKSKSGTVYERYQQTRDLVQSETRNMTSKEQLAYQSKMLQLVKNLYKDESQKLKDQEKVLKQQQKEVKEGSPEAKELQKLLKQNEQEQKDNKANARAQQNAIMSMHAGLKSSLANVTSAITSAMTAHFDKVISNNNSYRSSINTRLQGLQTTGEKWYKSADKWGELQRKITREFGTSMLINEQNILKNIDVAVKAGIANNIEQRAIIATLADNVADTFNAFSGELLRYIRLSQRDSTAVMLGMESSLTTFLNGVFRDTSYLSDVGTAAITGTLTEAMSQMNTAQATEFNFAVQKWLSSLYASGMSQSGIQSIAQAIGQAYSGDVTGVGSQMQNLLAMAATRGGQSYADIFKGGTTGASSVNDLMKAMVGYLASIAESSSNNVVRSAFGNVFGMSVSDLRAARNLMTNLETVSGQSTSVGTMLGQAGSMIGSIGERLGIAGMVNNLKENFLYTSAANLVNNPIGQLMYSMIKDFSGLLDFNIPSVSVLGNMFSFEGAKVSDIINAGIGGLGLLSGIGTLVSGLRSGNTLSIAEGLWNTWESSGTGFAGISGGSGRSLVYTGGAAGDISTSEYTDARSQATKTMGYDEGAGAAGNKDIDDIWTELSELRKSMFGESRKPILVDINPDTLPIIPVDVESFTASLNIANFMSGQANP